MGLAPEVQAISEYDVSSLTEQPLVSQPKELTERIWNNIKDEVIEFVQEKSLEVAEAIRKNTMLARDAIVSALYQEWLELQSPVDPFPLLRTSA